MVGEKGLWIGSSRNPAVESWPHNFGQVTSYPGISFLLKPVSTLPVIKLPVSNNNPIIINGRFASITLRKHRHRLQSTLFSILEFNVLSRLYLQGDSIQSALTTRIRCSQPTPSPCEWDSPAIQRYHEPVLLNRSHHHLLMTRWHHLLRAGIRLHYSGLIKSCYSTDTGTILGW